MEDKTAASVLPKKSGWIILWTTLAVMPVEFVFDAIEAALERRGINP